MPFYIKQNDTGPALAATLRDGNNAAVNLTGAGVRFHMRSVGGTTPKVDAAATIVTAASGTVRYNWIGANTDTSGSYEGEFEVTYADGSIETFPNDGYIAIEIVDDIT